MAFVVVVAVVGSLIYYEMELNLNHIMYESQKREKIINPHQQQ